MLLRHPTMLRHLSVAACRSLLSRLFAVPQVERVRLDSKAGIAEIGWRETTLRAATLQRLSEAFRVERVAVSPAVATLYLRADAAEPLTIFRHGDVLSTWEVVHELTGRVRLRHAALRSLPGAAPFVEAELRTVLGVRGARANGRTGTVLIEFDSRRLTVGHLLAYAEGALLDWSRPASEPFRPGDASLAPRTASLALAAVADFAVPGLAPVSAALLVVTNAQTFATGVRELMRRRLGSATLQTVIVGATLSSGFFFSAALMAWLMQFWDRQFHRRLAVAQASVLSNLRRSARVVWVEGPEGVQFETPVAALRTGDRQVVRAGQSVAAAGIVLRGSAWVDERQRIEAPQHVFKKPGERVPAGTLVHDGELVVEVCAAKEASRASAIADIVVQASTPSTESLKSRGETFARKTVPLALTAGGLGLFVGDVNMALAILRPDYATGPGMTTPLGALEDISHGLKHGIVLRDPSALGRVSQADVLVIDHDRAFGECDSSEVDSPPWRDSPEELRDAMARLRTRFGLRIGLVSGAAQREVDELGRRFQLDFACGDLSDAAKGRFVETVTLERGERVVWVGDGGRSRAAAAQAHVSLSWGDVTAHATDSSHAFLLEPRLTRLTQIWELAQQASARRRAHWCWTVVPNLCCVAGAFMLGFTSLHAVFLTNLGILTIYRSGQRWLRREDGAHRSSISRPLSDVELAFHDKSRSPDRRDEVRPLWEPATRS